jgi:hypothetical protein
MLLDWGIKKYKLDQDEVMDTLFGSVAQLLRQSEFFKEKYEFFKKVVSINQPASSPQLA